MAIAVFIIPGCGKQGIAYAGKTAGKRRFRRPAKREPWPGVGEAITFFR